MDALALQGNAKPTCAPARRMNVETRGFQDYGCIRSIACQYGGQRAVASYLLFNHDLGQNISVEPHSRILQGGERQPDKRYLALAIARAPAQNHVTLYLRG